MEKTGWMPWEILFDFFAVIIQNKKGHSNEKIVVQC